MNNVYNTLPEGYARTLTLDLQRNRKLAIALNLGALAIAAVMIIPALFAVPIDTLFESENMPLMPMIRFLAIGLSMIAYIILHELVHGVTMKLFGTKKVRYGFTGIYAFAGSEDFYSKRAYLTIALAPVVFWGLALVVLNLIVPVTWFWVVYFIQVNNISGAVGDMYVTAKFLRLPPDILVRDTGVSMVVYSK